MRVLVTGITGFLGDIVARRLLREGHAVRGLVRAGSRTPPSGVDVVVGDLCRRDDIERAATGVDAVVHCGARVSTRGSWDEFATANVDAVRHLLRIAEKGGIGRLLHVSSLSVYAVERDGAVVDEDSPYESGAGERGFYSRSKLAADELAMEAARRGVPVTVMRPGVLYGPGRRPPLGRKSFAIGPVRAILGSSGYLLPLSFGENTGQAILLALRCDAARGRAYSVVDPQLPLRQYLALYRAMSGATWVPLFIPARPVAALASATGVAFHLLGRRPPVTPHQIQRSTWSASYDCTRAHREIGWRPEVSLEEGLRRSLGAGLAGGTTSALQVPNYEAN